MADHTQRPRVTRQVDRMSEVPRNVGGGRHGEVWFTDEPIPKMVSIGRKVRTESRGSNLSLGRVSHCKNAHQPCWKQGRASSKGHGGKESWENWQR